MTRANNVGAGIFRIMLKTTALMLMFVIGIIQAVGTIITAISTVILKSISVLMIFVTLLLLCFGLFTWMKTLEVLLIAGSMFWLPEGFALVVFGLSYVQAKLMDLMNS